MSRSGRGLRFVLLGLLVVVLLVPLLLFGLLGSEAGSGWLLRQVVDRLQDDALRLELATSEGRLLDGITLRGVAVRQPDSLVEIDSLRLQWRPRALFDRVLHIETLQLSGVRVEPPPSDENAPPTIPQLPDIDLPIVVRLDQLSIERLAVAPGLDIDRIALAARLDAAGLSVSDLDVQYPGAHLAGHLAMAGRAPHGVEGQFRLAIDKALTGPDVGDVEAELTVGGEALRPTLLLHTSAPRSLDLRGRLALDQVEPGFDLQGDWQALSWPLQGKSTVDLAAGQLTLSGLTSAYRLQLKTRVRGEGMPDSGLDLNADGDLAGLRLAPLRVETLGGTVRVDGTLGWTPELSWAAELQLADIDPGRLLAEYPGRVSGRVRVDGRLAAAAPLQLRARIDKLDGELRGQPLQVGGELQLSGQRLVARELAIVSGSNRLSLNGTADQQLDLRFGISAPELAVLYPGLSGELHGAGTVSGTRRLPLVAVDLSGQKITFDELKLGALQLRADWQAEGGSARAQLTDLAIAGRPVSAVTVSLDGKPESHSLNLAMQAPGLVVDLAASGGLKGEDWEGQLDRLLFSEATAGEWQLQAPVGLQIGAARVLAQRLCLVQAAQQLCAEGGWRKAGGLDLSGVLQAIELQRLTRLLPGEATIEGQLAGRFSLMGPPDNPLLDLQLTPGDGLIRLEEGEEPFELAYANARLSAQLRDDVGKAELSFDLGAGGQARGQLTLGAARADNRSLDGKLIATFPDLALVAGFVPQLDAVQGRLQLDARVTGSLASPRLRGGLEVGEARARVPAAGIALKDVRLNVRGDGAAPLRIDGTLRSGEGRLTLDGTYDLAGHAVDLRLRGENFRAAQLPEALVEVSPDLRLRGGGPYELSGTLRVPKATIELKELPAGTVSVSDDEIIVGETAAVSDRKGPTPIRARVRLELGDAVTFKGFGLKTALGGALDAQVGDRDTRVDGAIELRDASYKAYGQNLTVERGRLLFAGAPDSPELDLRAVRESRDGTVKAYLAMSGPLSKPRPRVYSEPSLPEAEALAYLLTGNGVSQANSEQGVGIAAAALSLGISRGEPLLQDMSDRLGLDDLRVESGENGLADTSLIVGKYLNPDLYLGYSQGLFNPAGAVLLRLRLSEQLELESRSGVEQSVDLLYKLEHD